MRSLRAWSAWRLKAGLAAAIAAAAWVACGEGSAHAQGEGWTITAPSCGAVIAEGDSLTYGQDTAAPARAALNGSTVPRSRSPYPEALRSELRGVEVVNHGYPGDTSLDGLRRWAAAPAGQVVLIMYGTNDARLAVPVDVYRATMERLIRRRQVQGAVVIVLVSPPTTFLAFNARLEPYQRAAAQAAKAMGARSLDAGEAVRRLGSPFADPFHFRPDGYKAIADMIASHLRVSGDCRAAPKPQA